MAVLDDKTWLLGFIRNQFVISDDTSICETVLGPDLDPEEPNTSTCNFLGSANHGASSSLSNGLAGVTEKRQRALSPDIVLESDGRSSRRRSNTAVRLEKIRKERDEKGRVQTTRWKARPAGTPRRTTTLQSQQSVEDLDSAFASVDVKVRPDVPPRSLLSLKVEETAQVDIKQLFGEYAKFDGLMQQNSCTFMVYLHLPGTQPHKAPALSVCVVGDARFSDLIGLVCLRWTQANGVPQLKNHVSHYTLRYAEDDSGELDGDIPLIIELSEPVAKYGQTALALVENDYTGSGGKAPEPVAVKVNLVEGGFSKFVFDTGDITLREILEKVLKKRKMASSVRGLEYTLEKAGVPGVPLDLSQKLGSVRGPHEFWMVRVNRYRKCFLPLTSYLYSL